MILILNDPPQNGEGDRSPKASGGGVGGGRADAASFARFRPLRHALRARHLPVPGRNEERGFTLVEMMVVIVIIGLLATIVIINVLPATERAATARVKADLQTIESALDLYKLDNVRYPTTQEGLAAPTPRYVRRLPNDPWNTAYVYVTPGPNGSPYRIASLGADKKEGGSGEDADITN